MGVSWEYGKTEEEADEQVCSNMGDHILHRVLSIPVGLSLDVIHVELAQENCKREPSI